MASINKLTIVGNLGKNIELKSSSGGSLYCNFSVATQEHAGNDESGKTKYETQWHTVTLFGKTAEYAAKNGTAGSIVYVEGSLRTSTKDEKTYVNVKGNTFQLIYKKNGGSGSPEDQNAGQAEAEPVAQANQSQQRQQVRTQTQAPASKTISGTTTATAVIDAPNTPDDDLPF